MWIQGFRFSPSPISREPSKRGITVVEKIKDYDFALRRKVFFENILIDWGKIRED